MIELAPRMKKMDICKQIAQETRLDDGTIGAYIRTMKALERGETKASRSYRLLVPLIDACEKRPELKEKIKKAIALYRPLDPVQNAEDIAEKILELSKEHKKGREELKQKIGDALGLSGDTVAKHVQTMRALKQGTRPSAMHEASLYQMLKAEYGSDAGFREKIDKALEAYEETDSLEMMEKILDGIIEYAPLCRKGKEALKKKIGEKIEANPGSVKRYLQAMHAIHKEAEVPPSFKGGLYLAIEGRYRKDKGFRDKLNKAIDAYGQLELKKEIAYGGLVAEASISLALFSAKKHPQEKTGWAAENILKRVKYEALHKLAMERKIGTNELLMRAIREAEKSKWQE
jgi:hypothetical protein